MIYGIKIPEVLYHYCSVETFMKIIENKSLWLSNTKKMNDSNETIWINKLIDKKLQQLDRDKYKEFINNFITTYNINKNIPYITCFSEVGDLLSQWRAYANDGGGVAIGFSTQHLNINNFLPTTGAGISLTLGIHKCLYTLEEQEKLINLYIKEGIKENDYMLTVSALKRLSNIFKNHGFSEEKEWRIIHTPSILGNDDNDVILQANISDIKFRALKNDMTSYFTYDFKENANSNLIKEVILGPKCNINKYDLDMFLSINGFKNTEIKFSEVSYR